MTGSRPMRREPASAGRGFLSPDQVPQGTPPFPPALWKSSRSALPRREEETRPGPSLLLGGTRKAPCIRCIRVAVPRVPFLDANLGSS